MLLQATISHVAAIAGQNFRFWHISGRPLFIRVTEDEFARLERPPGAGCRHLSGAFYDRLGEPIAVAKVVVGIVERRCRLQVQRGEDLHPFAPSHEVGVFDLTATALGAVAGKQDSDGMKVGAGETADPVFRMVLFGVAEHHRARDHALPELFRERSECSFVHTERAQAVPGEGYASPSYCPFPSKRGPPPPTAPLQRSPIARRVHPRRCETIGIRIAP